MLVALETLILPFLLCQEADDAGEGRVFRSEPLEEAHQAAGTEPVRCGTMMTPGSVLPALSQAVTWPIACSSLVIQTQPCAAQ